jgi:hypothetical protein
MAFYGSSVANLSPILFRGNLFSEGVNIVFFTDVSYSMNLDSSGVSNYTSPRTSPGGNISVGSTVSMFYDGIFPSTLQNDLYTLKVGAQFQSSPNLYTYIDQTFRSKSFTQSLTLNTETTTFPNHFIVADSNYFNERSFKNLWKNQYINSDEGVFNLGSLRYNIASKVSSESTATRFSSFDTIDNPGQYSEDVHGNIWSFYYSGSNNASVNNITEGSVNTSYIGQFLNTPIRRNLPTYVIAASNEQENTASNLIGIGISTKNNVGYTTDKYKYNSSGFYVRRYRGYFLDDPDSPDPESSIESWFTNKAIPLPLGNTTTGEFEDAPGMNWFINGTPNSTATAAADLGGQPKIIYEGYTGGGTAVLNTDPSYAGIEIPNSQITPATQNLSSTIQKGGFWGPIFEIDRLRSDISNYTIMIVGYFAPQISGSFTFRIQSTGTSCFWIGSDATGIDGFGPDSKVYSGYTVSNSTITCPDNSGTRDNLLQNPDSDLNDVFSVTSANLNFTSGRYYPFRLILGNPNVGTNNFTPDGSLNFSTSLINPSFVRLLFDVNSASGTGSKENSYVLNGSGYFFGGREVWEEGSLFFRPPIQTVTRTIEEEVQYRNLRVIGISGYESNDGYDAVFVKKAGQEYIYANLSKYSYTFTTSQNPPSTWRFANYFKSIEYSITDSTSGFTRQNNTVTEDTTVGTGASFKIDKLNDRYIIQVRPGFAGTDYRIGDKFTISASSLGEDNIENNLVVGITSVQPLEYTVTALLSDNFAERTTTNATFTVRKNEFNNNNYSLTLLNGGTNYENGDKLLISGTELDGTSANNITITVTNVLSGGIIDTYSVSGTPTNYIDYQVPLNAYYPKTATFSYEPIDISSVYYRKGTSLGIGYTTARITGIAYTTGNIIGLAQSSFNISGIAYTNITSSTTGIAYSTSNIVGIGYTILSVTGAGFTHGNVAGIAYTTSTITNIGFTSTSVVSIGYTAPNIVSIGYTAFAISFITYPDAYTIVEYDPANDQCLITLNPSGAALPGNIGIGGKVLVAGTGEPALDNQSLSIINVLSDYEIEVSAPGLGAGPVQNPLPAKLIITQLDNGVNNNVGLGSDALLQTSADHTFITGDSIIIRGTTDSDWNSTFTVKSVESPTQIKIDNTGRTELFAATTIGSGSTVGYNQSELELVVPVTFRNVGITSIAYNLREVSPDNVNPYLLNSSQGFNQFNNNGVTASYLVTILGNGSGLNLDNYLQNGDIVYIFGTGTVFDYTNTGYGLTVTSVQDAGIGQDRFSFEFASQGGSVAFGNASGSYYIVNKLIPIVDAPSHGFSNGQLVSISGNENSVYNKIWQVAQAGINTFRLADSVTGIVSTAADLITNFGNTFNLSGTASQSITEYKLSVGMAITVFGVTGESAIYNDAYVISGIKSSFTEPYAFILKENQTPSTLALQGSSGKIGIHTISGIATVTSTSSFGSVGSLISIKIQDSPSSFFNKTYTNARILDSTRILLGSDSFRNQTTPNPNEYVSSSNANSNTIVGLVGDSLKVTHGTITPSGYTFVNGASIDIYGTTNFNGTYTINNVNGNILSLNSTSNSSTNFALRDTSGGIGVRGIGPVISFTNSYSFPSPYFGPNGSNIQVKLQDTGKTALNTNTARNARVISPTSILLTDNGLNPADYSNPGAGGTIGLIGANYYITVSSGANSIPVGSTVGIQNVLDQNGNALIADNLFTIQSNFGNDTGLIAIPSSSSSSTSSTNFGLRGNSGILGLRANAVVTTSSNHPFINGDSVQIENTTGNLGIFNNTFTITYVSPTQFILNSTNSTQYTDDFTNANATGGIAGLENYPATVTSTNHPFTTDQSVQIEGTANFNGSYTITKIDNDRFTLNGKTNPTSYTEISNSTIDPNGLITLKNAGPTVTYNGTPRVVGGTDVDFKTGDQVRIQNSTTFNGTYTVKRYTSTTFGITRTDPVSFTGINEGSGSIAGLVGSSVRIRTGTAHGLIDGQSIKIQNTSTGFDNKLYTVTTVDANLFNISNTVSTASTNFTITSTVGLVGYQNYPAIATFSNIIPSSFAVGSQIDIVNNDGTDTASSQQLSLPGPYTIAWRTDTGGLTRVGLQEAINPSNYSTVENNSGLGYTAGLRNSPAIIRFNSIEFSNLTFDLPLIFGDIISINITGTDNFDGDYNAKYTSSNSLELISPSTINPNDYSPNGDVNGVVGLANSDRIVRVNGGHGFTAANVGTTQVDIITGNITLQSDFGGTYFISEILDTENFALSGTQNPSGSISYTTIDTEGYYVIFDRGPIVTSTFSFDGSFVYQQHLLDQGDGVTITNSSLSGFNGNRTVLNAPTSTVFRMNGPYPSPITLNGRPDYKISGTLLYNQRIGLSNGNSNAAASLIIRRNATGITSSYTIQSIVSTGSNYKTNELYLIPGSNLGGTTGTRNDALVKIGSVDVNGGIQSTNLSILRQTSNPTISVPDSSLDYESAKTASIITGTGSGSQFRIVRGGIRTAGVTTYSTVELLSGGSLYNVNDVIRIPGNLLGGQSGDGTTNTLRNDLLIYIEQVISGGSISGTGFTFRGISRDSAPLVNSGLSTIYLDGGISRRSRPFGLEKVWDNVNDSGPPPNQGLLSQTHDMLTLAEANKGGVVKIDKVYTYGDIEKKAEIQELFFYSTSSIGHRDLAATNFEASILYDTGGKSGIATIIFDNDAFDQSVFSNIVANDNLYFITSRRSNPNLGVPYLDYRLINKSLNVIRANTNSSTDSGFDLVDEGTQQFIPPFATNNPGFAFGSRIDQIVIQTDNTITASISDDLPSGYKAIIINDKSVLTVRSDNHPFVNGEIVTIRLNRLFNTTTYVEEGTGIAYTSYRVRNATTFSFQLEDVSTGIGLTPSTIMPNGKKLIDYFAEAYVPNTSIALSPWTTANRSELYGNSNTWSRVGYPVIYASVDVDGNAPSTGTGEGDIQNVTRSLLSIEGEAYKLIPGGKDPVDNRVGLAKLIAKVISDATQQKSNP